MIFMVNHGVKNIKPCNKHSLETLVLVDFYILTCLILDPGLGIAAGGCQVFLDALVVLLPKSERILISGHHVGDQFRSEHPSSSSKV